MGTDLHSESAFMQRIRDRLWEQKTPANGDTTGAGVGNRHAAKDSHRVEMGWLRFNKGDYHQVSTRHGGVTQHLTAQKIVTMEELLEISKDFFPNGYSAKGLAEV